MPLKQVIHEVRRQLELGVPFERIEAFIEAQCHLHADEQAVVWLLAFFESDGTSLTYELGRNGNGSYAQTEDAV